MGGRGSRSGLTAQAPSAPATPQAPSAGQKDMSLNDDVNENFKATDSANYHELYGGKNYFLSQKINPDTAYALQDYLNPNPQPGETYAISQIINYKLNNGLKLDANEDFITTSIDEGMHNIGYNLTLTRYDRIDFMSDMLGIRNYESMTQQQLQSALIGRTYSPKGFTSTSYNEFRKAPVGNPFTDKAIRLNIKAPAKTQAFMPGKGQGGDFGEIILGRNQTFKITDIRYTGKMGRSGAGYHKSVEIDVEIQ